jgi:hypothetical protein
MALMVKMNENFRVEAMKRSVNVLNMVMVVAGDKPFYQNCVAIEQFLDARCTR